MTGFDTVPGASSGRGALNAPALVIALHGTRDPAGPGCAELLRERVAARLPGVRVGIGWVDVHEETLDRTLPSAGPAVVVPAFLSAGHHVRHDIPAAVARTHGLARVTPRVGPDLDAALRDRLVEAGPLGDGVVLASAGSRHEAANREVRATAGRLSALLGRPVEVGFFYARHPGLTEAVERLREAGAGSISVATHALFPGLHQRRTEALGLPVAAPIGVHEALIGAIVRRYRAALSDWAGSPSAPARPR